jgi:plasmid stabilization system protein ParE
MLEVRISKNAERDKLEIFHYLLKYSRESAIYHVARLDSAIGELSSPLVSWNYFYMTGAPFQARLFKIGNRTSFWIVYEVVKENGIVNILRIWNASQDGDNFSL